MVKKFWHLHKEPCWYINGTEFHLSIYREGANKVINFTKKLLSTREIIIDFFKSIFLTYDINISISRKNIVSKNFFSLKVFFREITYSHIFLRHVSYLYPWPDGRLGSKIESWSVIRFSNWEYKNERRHLLLTISAWQSGKEKKITLCVNIALKLDFSSHLDNAPNYLVGCNIQKSIFLRNWW